ncbi:hypothetical protein Pla52o_13650 [Novipirellula galeiformis]|uniref:Uncharacterized protein n=1 Tax=Novipirellula galeiformis TaxID=2528004 RepID=A0A5C6CKU7_9BACT|nr:hypothetical protein Pla52o_13650 [Novipirellula galeiformis]
MTNRARQRETTRRLDIARIPFGVFNRKARIVLASLRNYVGGQSVSNRFQRDTVHWTVDAWQPGLGHEV